MVCEWEEQKVTQCKSEMHELFTKILGKRDLSRAGDLFSVDDAEIVGHLTEVVSNLSSDITWGHLIYILIVIVEWNRSNHWPAGLSAEQKWSVGDGDLLDPGHRMHPRDKVRGAALRCVGQAA